MSVRVDVDEEGLPGVLVGGVLHDAVVEQAADQGVVDIAEEELSRGVQLVLETDLLHGVIKHFLRLNNVVF